MLTSPGNWFGGEAVSMQINYTDAESFRNAGYQPFMVDGEEYGEVREYGRFSFTRVYQAGHEGTTIDLPMLSKHSY